MLLAALKIRPQRRPHRASQGRRSSSQKRYCIIDTACIWTYPKYTTLSQEGALGQIAQVQCPGVPIPLYKGYVSDEMAATLVDRQVLQSDLVPGVYEGGFKLWEGSIDLCSVLAKEWWVPNQARPLGRDIPADLLLPTPFPTLECSGLQRSPLAADFEPAGPLSGAAVVELGCGHGLPGILAGMFGARAVHLQDYNEAVLRSVTAGNARANLQRLGGRQAPEVRYFAGDWGSLEGPMKRALGPG